MEIFSLNNNKSKYDKLVKYFEENKHKDINEWLTFDRMLDKPGKQGQLGIFKTNNNEEIVFKISQYINYLVYHELTVMQGLKEISTFCPHFLKGLGMISCKVNAKYDKKQNLNPFVVSNKYPIHKDILLAEFLDNSSKFYNYIRSEKISEEVLYSIIKQVLLAISIAQRQKKFTHYDLHSFNIMIKKCDKDIVFLYKIDEENQFSVPTLGYYPVIIDYGFSYISDMEDGPLWGSMAHTDVGFTSDRFDWVSDPKLFLVSVSDEIFDKRRTKKSRKLKKLVYKIFGPLTIDWECGWDDFGDKGVSDYVTKTLEKHNTISNLFTDYDHYCIDIIQTLIILPIQNQDYDNIHKYYKVFLKEWVKIENLISNPFFNLYILKNIVDVTRMIRPDYMNKQKRNHAISYFKQSIYNTLSEVSKFCIPKNINFEKLLCSLILLSKNIEGLMFNIADSKLKKKYNEYNKLTFDSVEQIYGTVSTTITDNYVYNSNTQVFIMDCEKKSSYVFKIPDSEMDNINSITHLARGTYIYDLYKNNIIDNF